MTEAERIRDEHLAILAALAEKLKVANHGLDNAVGVARQARLSWNQIGAAVGMTRQGARQKWGRIHG